MGADRVIAFLLAGSLYFTAPGGLPDSVTYPLPRVYRLEVRRYVQAPGWGRVLWHTSPPAQWQRAWPLVRYQALWGGTWTRRAFAGERVALDSLPAGSYLARWCTRWVSTGRDTCGDWSTWRTFR